MSDSLDCSVHGILLARILEWVAFCFSRVSSQPRDWTQVSHITGRFFTSWAIREAQVRLKGQSTLWFRSHSICNLVWLWSPNLKYGSWRDYKSVNRLIYVVLKQEKQSHGISAGKWNPYWEVPAWSGHSHLKLRRVVYTSFVEPELTLCSKGTLPETSLAFGWLRLRSPTAGGTGSIPGRGAKIPEAARCGPRKGGPFYPSLLLEVALSVFYFFLLSWNVNKLWPFSSQEGKFPLDPESHFATHYALLHNCRALQWRLTLSYCREHIAVGRKSSFLICLCIN